MPKQNESPLGAPCWVELFTSDADQAKSFYRELPASMTPALALSPSPRVV